MSIAWGEFEDMAIHYLRELAKRGDETPMLISKVGATVYGVCTYAEFAVMISGLGRGMYRPICSALPDEFMGLMLARFHDFTTEEENGVEEKDLPARE